MQTQVSESNAKNIMIVEDESIVAMDIRKSLQNFGYVVGGLAATGEDALNMVNSVRPDLILMDIRLKGEMDGITAAEQIHAIIDVPIIYLTANADEHTLNRAKKTEPYGYLLKPYDERELHTTIEMALYNSGIEKKLRESEQWRSTILRSIGDGLIATNARGEIKYFNPVAEVLTGWPEAEVIGRDLSEIFNVIKEETGSRIENPISTIFLKGEVVDLGNNIFLYGKDGTKKYIEGSASPIIDYKGNVSGVVLAFRDVTKLREEEEKQKSAHRLLENVYSSIWEALFVLEYPGRKIIKSNPAVEKMFGYKSEELIGKDAVFLHINEKMYYDFKRRSEEKIFNDEVFYTEYQLRRKDGSIFDTEHSVSGIWDSQGNLTGAVSLVRDITDRKKYAEEREKLLQKADTRAAELNAVIESLPDAVYIGNENGVNIVNELAWKMLKLSGPEKLLNKVENITKFIETRYASNNEPILPDDDGFILALKGEKCTREIIVKNTLNNEEFILRSASAPIVLEGKIIGAVTINTDITDQKLAEERLRSSEQRFRTVIQNAPVILFAINEKGLFSLFEGQGISSLGIGPEEIIGSSAGKIFEDLDVVEETGNTISGRDVFRRVLGGAYVAGIIKLNDRYFDTRFTPMFDHLNTIRGIIGVAFEVTERKTAEDERQKLLREVIAAESRLKILSKRLIEIQESERRHIARELHDEIGQTLSAIKIDIQTVNRYDAVDTVKEHLRDTVELVEHALTEVRNLSLDLRPSLLDDLGLIPALRWFVDKQALRANIKAKVIADNLNVKLPAEIEITNFRIVQEAFNNIIRHSSAKNVRVEVGFRNEELYLRIIDDGEGFNVQQAMQRALSGGSMGLLSMQERAELAGGKLSILSSQKGTKIEAVFKMENESEKEKERFNKWNR